MFDDAKVRQKRGLCKYVQRTGGFLQRKAAQPEKTGCAALTYIEIRCLLYLDLNLYTTGELELHQSVNRLSGRAVDVDQTLVV